MLDHLLKWGKTTGRIIDGQIPSPRPVFEPSNDPLLKTYGVLHYETLVAKRRFEQDLTALLSFFDDDGRRAILQRSTAYPSITAGLDFPQSEFYRSSDAGELTVSRMHLNRFTASCNALEYQLRQLDPNCMTSEMPAELPDDQYQPYQRALAKSVESLIEMSKWHGMRWSWCESVGLLDHGYPSFLEVWLEAPIVEDSTVYAQPVSWTGQFHTNQPRSFWQVYLTRRRAIAAAHGNLQASIDQLPIEIPRLSFDSSSEQPFDYGDFSSQLRTALGSAHKKILLAFDPSFNMNRSGEYNVQSSRITAHQAAVRSLDALITARMRAEGAEPLPEHQRSLQGTRGRLRTFIDTNQEMVDHLRLWDRIVA